MFKLIKYEIKTISKEFFIILGAVVLLNIALMTRIHVWSDDAIVGLSFLILFGASVATFIYNIITFTRDLKQDTGYLIFSIPKSGYSILGAKLISSLIVTILVSIVGFIMMFLVGIVALGNFDSFIKAFTDIKNVSNLDIFKFVLVLIADAIICVLLYVQLLLVIYFAVSISRAIMNKRKFSGLVAFLIFVVTNLLIGKIYQLIYEAFPKTINPYVTIYGDNYIHSTNASDPSILLMPVDIVGGIFYIIVMIGLFIGIGYILEKKIDL